MLLHRPSPICPRPGHRVGPGARSRSPRANLYLLFALAAACRRPPPSSGHHWNETGSWLDAEAAVNPSRCTFSLDGPDVPSRGGPLAFLRRLFGRADDPAPPTRASGFLVSGALHASLRCNPYDMGVIPRMELALDGKTEVLEGASRFAFEDVRSGDWQAVDFRLSPASPGLYTITPVVSVGAASGAIATSLPPFYALATARRVFVGEVSEEQLMSTYAQSLPGLPGPAGSHRGPPAGGGATVDICADSVHASGWDETIEPQTSGGPPCILRTPLRVFGGLSIDDAVQALSPHRAELRSCVRSAGAITPVTRAIPIELVVQDRHARTVVVRSVDLRGGPLAHPIPPGIAQCLERVIDGIEFPAQVDDEVTFIGMTSTTEMPDGRPVH